MKWKWNFFFGIFVAGLTELELGGFGQGLPPPGPLENTHTLEFFAFGRVFVSNLFG